MKNALKAAVVVGMLGFWLVGTAAGDLEMSGSWTRQEQKIAGSWSIVEENGRLRLRLSDDFKTKSGPDLKIFLSRGDLDSITGKNATQDAVLVAPLGSSKGGQSYAIPGGVDLSQFKSLIIHCDKYSKLWGGSSL